MTANPQSISQFGFLFDMVIPVIVSLIIYIFLSNLIARLIKKLSGGKMVKFTLISLATLILVASAIFLFIGFYL